MNIAKLKEREEQFLNRYPGGFQNPEMEQIGKRHNISRLVSFAQAELTPEKFSDPDEALEAVSKLVSRSSLVSVFEKTAFRNHLDALPAVERADLAEGFRELIHGDQEAGFERVVSLLAPYKLAKWTIITAVLYYRDPAQELVIKPTTVKGVIAYFDIKDIIYQPKPTYDFYRQYREKIRLLKMAVGEELQVENGAFCGFLMFATGRIE